MATFTAGTSFVDGVTGDVTAAKLGALVTNAVPLPNLITDRTAETAVATNDLLVISNTSSAGALNKMTVADLMKAELTGTINSTSGTIATGVIPTLTSTTLITTGTGTAAAPAIVPTGDTNTGIFFPAADTIAFSEGGAEAMRITSNGYLKASNTGAYVNAAAAFHELRSDSSGNEALVISNSSTIDPFGIQIRFAAVPNNATSTFFSCIDGNGATNRADLRSNGGFRNYQANDANLSDERLKKDIITSPNYLEKICSIPVVNFKYKDQTHDDYNLGVIAQQLEVVCPEFVDADGFGETPADGIPIKTIYQTDLQYALMKCIQELKSENDSLKSRIEALEAA